jgi:hypothetical protein
MLPFPARLLALPFAALFFLVTAYALPSPANAVVLEEYFRGKTVGKGVFESKVAGVYRPFTVYLKGTWNAGSSTLRLREDFVYADGERDTKTWIFQKTGPGSYVGKRADIRGQTHLRTVGDSLKFSYVADVVTGDKTIGLRFRDTLTQVDRRIVRNTARVYRFGFPIGSVDLTFKK